MGVLAVFSALCLAATPLAARDDWFPVSVSVWDPPFNTDRQRVDDEYEPLKQAERRWRICLLIPHLKDAYWLAVNFAMLDEARRLGIGFAVHSAGGYGGLDRQLAQFDQCLAEGADGILLGAVSLEDLNESIARATRAGVPVVDLINGVSSPDISARVGVDFWDMGRAAGEHMRALIDESGSPVRVAWLPGPAGAGWVDASDAGFRHAVAGGAIEIVETLNGDTGRDAQEALVLAALERQDNRIDFIVGTAITAEAAVSPLRELGLADRIGVIADYYSPGVHRAIRRGQVLAAPSDLPALQTRIALDTIVRILEGRDHFPHVAAQVVMIDRQRLGTWDPSASLPPRGFRPVFTMGWQ
jgi:protein TorT